MKLIHRGMSGPLPASRFDLVNDAGEVLGFCQVRHRPSHNADLPPEAGNHIYYEIAEAHRGKGYGKALMGLALAEARRIALDRVRLTCLADSLVSKHIIEGTGAVWLQDFAHARQHECHRCVQHCVSNDTTDARKPGRSRWFA